MDWNPLLDTPPPWRGTLRTTAAVDARLTEGRERFRTNAEALGALEHASTASTPAPATFSDVIAAAFGPGEVATAWRRWREARVADGAVLDGLAEVRAADLGRSIGAGMATLRGYVGRAVRPAGALPSRKGERFILGDPARVAALLDRAARLYTKWTSAPAPEPALAELFRAWAAGLRPGWPPVATADPEGPMPALLAFVVATADVSVAEELELVARLAEALAAPAP